MKDNITASRMGKIYRELSKADARCSSCRYCSPLSPGDDLADCTLEESRIWTDDHACYRFSPLDKRAG